MLNRSSSRKPRHSVQAIRLPIFGVLVFLALAAARTEARAEDSQPISTLPASSVASLQVARASSSAAQPDEAGNASGLAQDYVTIWPDGDQPASQSLDLDIFFEQTGGFYETVDDNERNLSARVARIASCYEASVGRYHSEERGAFSNALSELTNFNAAMTHFTAQRDSRLQFDSCLRF